MIQVAPADGPFELPQAFTAVASRQLSWDPAVRPRDASDALAATVERSRQRGTALVARRGSDIIGVATLEPLAWDSAHFGLSAGAASAFAGLDDEALGALAPALAAEADRSGFDHVRCSLEAGERAGVRALEASGFRSVWTSVRMVHEMRHPPPAARWPKGLEITDSAAGHLAALEPVRRALPAYSWLQEDPALPADRRAGYGAARLESCVARRVADLSLSLVHRGRAVGLHASQLVGHLGLGLAPFTHERDTFVSSRAPAGAARLLVEEALRRRWGQARLITGRVGLEHFAMLRMLESVGFAPAGGEIVLTRARPPG